MSVHFSSQSDEWGTPRALFDKLNTEFGFTLDAASTDGNALCRAHFTAAQDALKQDWHAAAKGGAVWLNPPYSRGSQAAFIRKAAASGCVVVCLIPARTDTRVWHDTIFPKASEIRFIAGRIRFNGAKAGAPFPSALVVFNGPKPAQRVSSCKL